LAIQQYHNRREGNRMAFMRPFANTIIVQTLICLVFFNGAYAEEKQYTITDAYRAAINDNEIIKIAEESVVQSDTRIDQAWTYLYPRLNARAAYTRFNEMLPSGGGPFIFQPTDSYQAALVLTQPLYTGGRTLAALRSAQKMREASAAGLSVTRQDLTLSVAEAYYSVMKAQKAVDISKRSLERMERHQLITEREASTRKSKANQSALLRANSLVSQARISLLRSQDGLTIARDKLSLLTKLPKDAKYTEPPALDQPAGDLNALVKTALTGRDDYAASIVNRNIAEENVTIVSGGHHPQLYAEAGMTYQDSRPETA